MAQWEEGKEVSAGCWQTALIFYQVILLFGRRFFPGVFGGKPGSHPVACEQAWYMLLHNITDTGRMH